MRYPAEPIPNPGAAASPDVFDTGAESPGSVAYPTKGQPVKAHRYRLMLNADQVVNIRQMWAAPGGTLRQIGADAPTVANTPLLYERDLLPGRNVIRIVTTTAPTVWEAAQETVDQAL